VDPGCSGLRVRGGNDTGRGLGWGLIFLRCLRSILPGDHGWHDGAEVPENRGVGSEKLSSAEKALQAAFPRVGQRIVRGGRAGEITPKAPVIRTVGTADRRDSCEAA